MNKFTPREFAASIVRTLVERGHRAVFAGGCVRDMLLGAEPKDFDVATSALPEELLKIFPRTVAVGIAFGVVRVLGTGRNPLCVEVATFRGDGVYSDGRHPDSIAFTDEVQDVKRRDFTINGLLFDPLKDELLDYVEGRRDIDRKVVRAIGDPAQRFADDRLRMLRAVRFAARLDFKIDALTLAAIKTNAESVLSVSAERIRDELSLMLTGPNPRHAFELLKKSHLLKVVLPEVDALEGVAQPPQYHPEGDVWTHTLLLLGQLEHAPLTLALAALLHDIGKPATLERTDRIRFIRHESVGAKMSAGVLARLKFPNAVIDQTVALVAGHMRFNDARAMRPATLKRFLRQEHFDEHLALHKLDCLASNGDVSAHEYCVEQLARIPEAELRPPALITGADLHALGLAPGPMFAKILKAVEERQLVGTLLNKTDALAYVMQAFFAKKP